MPVHPHTTLASCRTDSPERLSANICTGYAPGRTGNWDSQPYLDGAEDPQDERLKNDQE